MAVVCKDCGFKHKSDRNMFCVKCGSLIDSSGFKNEDLLRSTEKEIKEFIEKADSRQKEFSFEAPIPGLQGLFDNLAGVRGFLDAFLEQERKNEGNLNDEDLRERVDRLEKFAADCEALSGRDTSFQVAVVGTVKAGKSTLINAMLKGQYASVDVTPETAVLTKFYYSDKDQMTVLFYNEKEWGEFWKCATEKGGKVFEDAFKKSGAESDKSKWLGHESITEPLDIQKLKEYTGATSASHYYVKEVKVGLKNFPYDHNVVLVDTPGLNDPVPYRSQVSTRYIRQANAVLLCVDSSRLEDNLLKTASELFDYTGGHPEKVYVLATKYENFTDPVEDWKKQKKEWVRHLSSGRSTDRVQFTDELAEKNIIPVSGQISCLLRMYRDREQIDEKNMRWLKGQSVTLGYNNFEDNVQELERFSNVDYVRDRIREDLLKKVDDEIKRDMESSYEALRSEISGYFDGIAKGLEDVLSNASKGVDEIRNNIKKGEEDLEKMKIEQKQLNEFLNEFKESTEELINGLDGVINGMIEGID